MPDSLDLLLSLGSIPAPWFINSIGSPDGHPASIRSADRIATAIISAAHPPPDMTGPMLGTLAGKGCNGALRAAISLGADTSGRHGTDAIVMAVLAGSMECLETLLLAGASCDGMSEMSDRRLGDAQSEAFLMLESWNEAKALSDGGRSDAPSRPAPGI